MRNRVSELRSANGTTISQADLAKVLGVSRQTVISIERGVYNPSLPLAFKIAEHFGLPIEGIFYAD